MPTEIAQAVTAIQNALAGVPGALLVIVLLGGPTVIWLVYRALNAAAPQRFVETATDVLWICGSCRSANGLGARSCYRCGAVPDDEELEFVSADPSPPIAAPPPMIQPVLDPSRRPLVAGRAGPANSPPRRHRSPPGAAATSPPPRGRLRPWSSQSPRRGRRSPPRGPPLSQPVVADLPPRGPRPSPSPLRGPRPSRSPIARPPPRPGALGPPLPLPRPSHRSPSSSWSSRVQRRSRSPSRPAPDGVDDATRARHVHGDAPPRGHRRWRVRRAVCGTPARARPGGRPDPGRSPQLPPVPADALPGGDRRPVAGEIAQPLRSILRKQRNTTVLLGEAIGIDVGAPRGPHVGRADPIAYDTLIVATGAHHTYFGHDEWASVAPGLKTLEDATEIRRRILIAFEAAEREADPQRRRAWMTFVLVGGGPTGVELAGSLGEIASRHAAPRLPGHRSGRCPDHPGRGDGPGAAAVSRRTAPPRPSGSSNGSG